MTVSRSMVLSATILALGALGVAAVSSAGAKDEIQRTVAHDVSDSLTRVVDTIQPSVVSIRSAKKIQAVAPSMRGNPFENTPFEHFFDNGRFEFH